MIRKSSTCCALCLVGSIRPILDERQIAESLINVPHSALSNLGRTGHSPRSVGDERLFVAGLVSRIVRSLDLREALEAGSVDLCDPVLDGCALNVVFDFAVAQYALECDELARLERLGELGETAPRIPSCAYRLSSRTKPGVGL